MNLKILLVLICLLFLFTRLYKITEIPASVYWDEASIGYNAYSIVQTGKDEWGEFLPIHFRAFGEFKLPVYIYSAAVFVKIFGLNEFSVRFPAVLYSLGTVLITYFLAKKITGSEMLGLWSSFFITISPWFFIFSRTGFEVTAGLMFYLLAILLFLQNRKGGKFILFSAVSFILSAYSYNSFRIISPLTILVLIFFERNKLKEISKIKTYFLISALLLILAFIPIFRLYIYDAGISRLQVIGTASKFDVVKNYLSHFDPIFLFVSGDKNLRHQQKDFGQLYFPELIFIVAGFIYILRKKLRYGVLFVILVLLAPIPAAITKESPHGLRSLSVVPFIHIISAMGVFYIGQKLNKNLVYFFVFILFLFILFLVFFTYYFINFLNVYPSISSKDWQYSYKKIFTDSEFKSGNNILVSEEGGQPYIFALFYLQYDPDKFRREVIRNPVDKWGFSTVKSFGKYEFSH